MIALTPAKSGVTMVKNNCRFSTKKKNTNYSFAKEENANFKT